MYTVEKKVDLIMKYLIASDVDEVAKLKKEITKALKGESVANVSEEYKVECIIRDILKQIGTPSHILGFEYTITATKLAYEDREHIRSITKTLYPDTAKIHKTTSSRMERAVRHAVESTFDRGNFDDIVAVFGNTFSVNRGKLTNSEFIAGLVNEVDRRMKYEKG